MSADKIKYGPAYHIQKMVIYAANGSIVTHDERDADDCNILSIATVEERCRVLQDQLDKLNNNPAFDGGSIEHRRILRQMLGCLSDCLRDAKRQGDPLSPEVQKWYRTHQPGRRGRGEKVSYEVNQPPPRSRLLLPDQN